MNKGLLIGGIIILLGAIGAFAMRADSPQTPDMQISATIAPIAMIAEEIVGNTGSVHTILAPGASPHTFEPTPQDIRNVSDSSLIFAVGHEVDTWVTDIAAAANNVPVETVDTGIALLTYDDHDHAHDAEGEDHHEDEHEAAHHDDEMHDDHADEHHDEEGEDHHEDEHEDEHHEEGDVHDHEHGEYDPHYWLSPDNARIIAATVRDILSSEYPANEAAYEANYMAFIQALDAAEAEWSKELARVADSRIVTFHDAWAYFAAYADIAIVATVEPFPGQQPTPQYLAELEDTVRDANVAAVFTEPQLASDAIESFIADTGAVYGILDPIGGVAGRDTYIDLMTYNIKTLANTLR